MKPTTASMAASVLLTCDKAGPDEKMSAAPGVRVEEMFRLVGGVLGDAPVRDAR
ncbi:hypothetical protein [Nocardia abscessus]|uniref:hypothetical protein n=1 Tax=Nocardia abscessus TaxID=120957 RepID=UPI00031AB5EE|nr:hypothetical protein [Nocardia abscessus]MCC3332643.1 hypothetical protein [Nocardia abscessus]